METNPINTDLMPKNEATPLASAAAKPDEEIPPDLAAKLAQLKERGQLQQIAMIFPGFEEALKTEKATEATEAFAGLLWGIGVDFGINLPDWVKAASEKYCRGMGFDFLTELKNTENSAMGKLVELSDLSPKNEAPSEIENVAKDLVQLIKTKSGDMPAEELKQYVDGRLAAPKIIEKAKNPSERTIAFLSIAGGWRQVEKLGSRTKTYKWLKENKLISPNTEWDEVKNWLKEINMPKGKAGAPKKIGVSV